MKFDELVNFGDLQFVGLSKVQFFTPQASMEVVDTATDDVTSGKKRNWILVLSLFAAAAILVVLLTRKQKQQSAG